MGKLPAAPLVYLGASRVGAKRLRAEPFWLEPCMRRPTFKRRLLICALGLLGLGTLVAWKALPGGDPVSTVAVTRGNIESSVTACDTRASPNC